MVAGPAFLTVNRPSSDEPGRGKSRPGLRNRLAAAAAASATGPAARAEIGHGPAGRLGRGAGSRYRSDNRHLSLNVG